MNSKNELNAAEKYLSDNDLKGTVRSSASAVDAAVRYYCYEWNVPFPRNRLPFNQKIDAVLSSAGRPTYSSIDNEASKSLLHLYRARNAMHVGDCYYKCEDSGNEVEVNKLISKEFYNTAKEFVVWLDSQI